MSYLDWKVGDSVVCVAKEPWDYFSGEICPERNVIYTIREIMESPNPDDERSGHVIFVRLNEIVNVPNKKRGNLECGFWIGYFRKVNKNRLDVFTNMLNQTPLTNQIELAVKERVPENV